MFAPHSLPSLLLLLVLVPLLLLPPPLFVVLSFVRSFLLLQVVFELKDAANLVDTGANRARPTWTLTTRPSLCNHCYRLSEMNRMTLSPLVSASAPALASASASGSASESAPAPARRMPTCRLHGVTQTNKLFTRCIASRLASLYSVYDCDTRNKLLA